MYTLKDQDGRLFAGFYFGVPDWCEVGANAKRYTTKGQAQAARVKLWDCGFRTVLMENGRDVKW